MVKLLGPKMARKASESSDLVFSFQEKEIGKTNLVYFLFILAVGQELGECGGDEPNVFPDSLILSLQ